MKAPTLTLCVLSVWIGRPVAFRFRLVPVVFKKLNPGAASRCAVQKLVRPDLARWAVFDQPAPPATVRCEAAPGGLLNHF